MSSLKRAVRQLEQGYHGVDVELSLGGINSGINGGLIESHNALSSSTSEEGERGGLVSRAEDCGG